MREVEKQRVARSKVNLDDRASDAIVDVSEFFWLLFGLEGREGALSVH